jgi:putative hemolysin
MADNHSQVLFFQNLVKNGTLSILQRLACEMVHKKEITINHKESWICLQHLIKMEVQMFRKSIFTLLVLTGTILFTSCSPIQATQIPTPATNMANPASVYCEQNGGTLDLRQDVTGGVAGVCVFPDGSECDEWAYFRGECKPADPTPTTAPESAPTEFPTPRTIDPADYQGWWTYSNSTYGFSLMLPSDWVVDETTTGDALMNGHMLMLQSPQGKGEGLQIRMTFRRIGEDIPLWPTGVGAGEFVQQGTLDVAGQSARRVLFVCPTGQVNSIWYQGASESDANIQRGAMEFGFIFSLTGFYCEEGHSLSGKIQYVGEMVIASLQMP